MENGEKGEQGGVAWRRMARRAWRDWARTGRRSAMAGPDSRTPAPQGLGDRLGAEHPEPRIPLQGMTLIEIMVVIAIIGLIMGAVAFLVIPRFQQSKEKVAGILVQKVYNAAAEYYTIAPPGGRCPTLDDLTRENLIKREQTKDPWGKEMQISCEGDVVSEVRSSGKDTNMGNDDDISYSETQEEGR